MPTAKRPATSRLLAVMEVILAFAAGLSLLSMSLHAGEGPGLPRLNFSSGDEYSRELARLRAPTGMAHGRASMIGGYFFVPFFKDQSPGGGGIDIYDLSNPIAPVLSTPLNPIRRIMDNQIREPHAYGSTILASGNRLVVLQATNGIDLWNFTDPANPVKYRNFALPNVSGGVDYAGIWWVFVQYPYVYAGGNSSGLYIVNIADPMNPSLVSRIDSSALGGFSIASVHAVGNLLVLASNAQSSPTAATLGGRYAFLDIGNPTNPQVIRLYTQSGTWPNGYATLVNGNKLLVGGVNSRFHSISITDPDNIVAGTPLTGPGPGGYVNFQDGFAHSGFQTHIVKVNVTGANPTLARQGTTSNGDKDDNFAIPLGNLIFAANDHLSYSSLMVQNAAADNTPPAVNMVHPRNGATNQPTTTRVGLTFTDELRDSTLTPATITIRRQGFPTPLPGRYSYQTNIVNFTPDSPFIAGATYEVVVNGGVQDISGNTLTTPFSSSFTIGGGAPVAVVMTTPTARTVGTNVPFTVASSSGTAPLQYKWSFGDGATTAFSSTSSASHSYASANHYTVTVTVKDALNNEATSTRTQLIHVPTTTSQPTASGQLAYVPGASRLYTVNPDADTVTVINTATLAKVTEIAVGRNPRSAAVGPGNTLWVANQDSGTLSVIDTGSNTVSATVTMPYGSQPFGVAVAPDQGAVYVSLHATGKLLKINPITRQIISEVAVGPKPRGVAVSHDSQSILVTRFISGDNQGEVREVAASAMTVTRTYPLAKDTTTVDDERGARGLPNHVASVTIAPDGKKAWVPSKKDNILRGRLRDGRALTFESTVRTIVSQLDLVGQLPQPVLDLNDRDSANAIAFSPLGNHVFIATQGTNTVEVVDAYDLSRTVVVVNTGLAPQGLAVSPDGTRLFVHNFMGRSVGVYDISTVANFTSNVATPLATIATVASEKLTPTVLAGKRTFYNANVRSMNRDGYISCASCHSDGGSDGRVWDFTGSSGDLRREGLRRTTNLLGRSGVGHGPVHWTGNFDEIHDFEHDARTGFGGTGLMSDAQFTTGTRNTPLGDLKAGISSDLDALAAYVSSLSEVKASPHRQADGALTSAGVAGKAVFETLNCASCHQGPRLTDSRLNLFHNVGTIKPSSGLRLGAALTGLDTPTLKGVWSNDVFLHDGSAASLFDVLVTANPSDQHGAISGLSTAQRSNLIAYLQQIDDAETPAYQQPASGDSVVTVEAESFAAKSAPSAHSWIPVGAAGGFAGAGGIQALPNTGNAIDANLATATPRADYRINFTRTGTHYVMIRGMGASTADNSVHIGLDGTPSASANAMTLPGTGSLEWVRNNGAATPATITVPSVGIHTLNVWMREDGVVVDRLLLTVNAALATPIGTGPSETPTTSAGGNPPPVVTITAPTNGANVAEGTAVLITATASDDGSVAQVQFLRNGIPLHTDTTAGDGWSFTWVGATPGSHSLTAIATDNLGSTTNSAAVGITVTAAGGGAFAQDAGAEGLVAMEAENAVVTTVGAGGKTWDLVTAPSGFSGTGAKQALANSGVTVTTSIATTSPRLDFPVTFNRTGVHYVWVRGLGATTADNSIHVGLDGSTVATADNGNLASNNLYAWSNATTDGPVMTITVPTTGAHTLNVWMREDGVVVDKVVLTSSAGFVPSGTGPSESPTGGAPPNVPPAVSLTSPSHGAIFAAPATVNLVASASDSDGIILVEFLSNGTVVGSDTDPAGGWTHSWTGVIAGSYTLTARATDGLNATSTSSAIGITVTGGAAPGTFTQSGGANGLVGIEAENTFANASVGGRTWTQVTSPSGYLGAGAMQALPNTGAQVATGYDGTTPRMDYRITFNRTGVHYVWVRGLGATTADNSIHIGLNGPTPSAENITLGTTYGWISSVSGGPRITVNVPSVGEHTLKVWMREDGVVVDALEVTSDSGYIPPAGASPVGTEPVVGQAVGVAASSGGAGGGGGCGLGSGFAVLFACVAFTLRARR